MLLPLVQHTGCDRPVYGLRSFGQNAHESPYNSIPEIAAHHICALQAVQPAGPYLIGGYSFGGRVAFEVARQLSDQGHQISQLIILDISLIDSTRRKAGYWSDARFRYEFANSYGNGSDFIWSYDEFAALRPRQQMRCIAQHLKKHGVLLDMPEIEQLAAVYRANLSSNECYTPPIEALPVLITLIRADEIEVFSYLPDKQFTVQHPEWGWEQFSAYPITCYQVPGNHFTVIEPPHVIALADCIRDCMKTIA